MDHPQIDLNAYALGEGTPAEREAAAQFLSTHPEAHEDFERLALTLTALQSVRDEEIPRRIAFVSDPVFEPSLWQRFWASTPRLAFAGAALLAVAITAHGYLTKPLPVQPVVQTASITQADIDAAVTKAVNAVEARTEQRVRQEVQLAVAATEKRSAQEIQMMSVAMQENMTILRKQLNKMYVTNAGLSVGASQE
jgi:anti-sigma factor RsiW